ncbi:MAG TPA: PadR family transcriptional regulator [Amnibacterium sp.]|nr:PadR family transcriptional regulator [Amnibacterium sp.]
MSAAVFGHGQLRLVLLALLDEREQHGYDLIQGLSDRFGGTYVPSAGTVYPRLAKLEEEGLVVGRSDGRRTVYAITAAGRAELASRRRELEGIEEQVGDSVRRLANEVRATVGDAMRSLRADLAAASAGAAGTTHPTPGSWSGGSERPGRPELRRAEVHLAEFRAQLHADLKAAAATGRLTDDVVRRLAVRLDELRRELQASLRG